MNICYNFSFMCSTYLLQFFRLYVPIHILNERFCSFLLQIFVTNFFFRFCITSICFTDYVLQVCCSFLSEAIYLLYQCLNSNGFCIWMRSGDESTLTLFNFRLVLEETKVGQKKKKKGGR